ncbi:MAG: AMP-binding protein [Archangium sp.]|nr:AMP-binding protein [Archangium sp.]
MISPSDEQAWLRGPPLPGGVASSLWAELLDGDPSQPWLVFHTGTVRTTLSRADVAARALGWAAALRQACPGLQRVGVLLPNGPDFVAAFFAAQALGAVAVPLPWPVVDGAPDKLIESLRPVLGRARLDVLATTPGCAAVDWGTPVVTEGSAKPFVPGEVEGPLAFMQFTSGSTGDPRGAVISQRAALGSARAMASALGLGPSDVGVSWLPFFHDMGLVGVLLTSLVARFPVHVLRPGDFLMRPRRWLDLVSSERATLTVGPNFAWELLVRRVAADGLDLSSLRCALNGSEPIHRTTLDGFTTKFAPAGFKADAFLSVYGLAEATLGVAFSRPGAPKPDLDVAGRPVPCVGAVLPGIELCVADADGRVKRPGEEGELCVRGPTVMSGYFEHADATAATMRGDWLRTGDLGVVRGGTVYVTGREKELVIQAGRKFHPYDIERVVAAMVEATPNGVAAVSRPDAAQGSEGLVVVIELRRVSGAIDPMLIKGELLRVLGVRADVIEFVPAGTLPRTTSGKVKRKAISTGVSSVSLSPLSGAGSPGADQKARQGEAPPEAGAPRGEDRLGERPAQP